MPRTLVPTHPTRTSWTGTRDSGKHARKPPSGARRCARCCSRTLKRSNVPEGDNGDAALDAAVKDLRRWAAKPRDLDGDVTKNKAAWALVHARHAVHAKRNRGKALDTLVKERKELVSRKEYETLTKEMIRIYESLNDNDDNDDDDGARTDHLIANAEEDLHNRFPVTRQIFF